MTTIIDYGIGNLRSIEKAFQSVGAEVLRTDEPAAIASADRLVLPGVGAFGTCMGEIRRRGLEGAIQDAIEAGMPFLGVCVGMQLLFDVGQERGTHQGLGVLSGRVDRFDRVHAAERAVPAGPASEATSSRHSFDLKIPHMGWNTIRLTREAPLVDGIKSGAYVYFVHSYHAVPDRTEDVLATTHYGHDFPAMIHRDNVYGVQFHPEKSQEVGLHILRNFAEL